VKKNYEYVSISHASPNSCYLFPSKIKYSSKYYVLKATLKMAVLRTVALYNLTVYRRFRGIHRPDNGSRKYLWNISRLLPDITAQQPIRQPFSYSPMREPHISQTYPKLTSSPHLLQNTRNTVLNFHQLVNLPLSYKFMKLLPSRLLQKSIKCLLSSTVLGIFIQQTSTENIFQLPWTCLQAKHKSVLNGNARDGIH
jgi:hypothetical protein